MNKEIENYIIKEKKCPYCKHDLFDDGLHLVCINKICSCDSIAIFNRKSGEKL